MTRLLVIVGGLMISRSALAGETVLDIVMGQMKGKATLVNSILANGNKYVRMGMILEDANGRSVSVLQESTYSKTGRPIRKLQTTTMKGEGVRQSLVAIFDESGANLKIEQGGKSNTDLIPMPSGKSIEAAPEFWFVRDDVKVGGVKTYWRFDLAARQWVETVCTYHGKRELGWAGKKVSAHYITYGEIKAYVDDSGDPYLIDTGSSTMTRRAK